MIEIARSFWSHPNARTVVLSFANEPASPHQAAVLNVGMRASPLPALGSGGVLQRFEVNFAELRGADGGWGIGQWAGGGLSFWKGDDISY